MRAFGRAWSSKASISIPEGSLWRRPPPEDSVSKTFATEIKFGGCKTLAKFGSEAKITSPQEFTAFMAGETQKWSNVAKAAHVEIE